MADVLFHGEFSSANASALSEPNSRVVLYPATSVTAIVVASTDIVVVTDVVLRVGASGLTVQVYDGADNIVDAGETVHAGTYAASTGQAQANTTPHFCRVGTWPKVKTSGAGQIDVALRGYVRTTA